MPGSQFQIYNFVAGNNVVANAAETAVGGTLKANSSYAGCTFGILFVVQFTASAATTSVIYKIGRGTVVGGTNVLTSGGVVLVASSISTHVLAATDQIAGEVASQQWFLSATTAGGAGNSGVANVYSAVTIAE